MTTTHVLNLETPVGASLYDGVLGLFVRLYLQQVAPDDAVLGFTNLDILYEDLGAFIETLQEAKRAIEARMVVIEGEVTR